MSSRSENMRDKRIIELAKFGSMFLQTIKSQQKDLTKLGRFSRKTFSGNIDRAKAILNTAGNKYTNNLFVACLNMLIYHLFERFPHLPTIKDDLIWVKQSYNWAMAGDAQDLQDILRLSFRELIKYTDIKDNKKRKKKTD